MQEPNPKLEGKVKVAETWKYFRKMRYTVVRFIQQVAETAKFTSSRHEDVLIAKH